MSARPPFPPIDAGQLEAGSLRIPLGPVTVEVERAALRGVSLQLRAGAGQPRLHALEAATAEISTLKIHGPLAAAGGRHAQHKAPAATGATAAGASVHPWQLEPLAAAEGTVRGQIRDAHLLFDADVTVPLRQGRIDFNKAAVEHVGPDSRMGVSRMGLYVDAPNGRSYLFQFPSAPVAGVQFERRGAVLGAFVSDRGSLDLRAFGEAMLRQAGGGQAVAITAQARQLFERTALSGHVQLGDGLLIAPGLAVRLAGRADRANLVRLHSESVGRGISARIDSLRAGELALDAGALQLSAASATGAVTVRAFLEAGQLRFALEVASLAATGLRLSLSDEGTAGD